MPAHHRHHIEKACRQRLAEIAHQVDLAGVQSMSQLAEALATWRQRPIQLLPLALPPGLTGIWLAEAETDIIIYMLNAPQTLIDQAIGHELAHLLSGHCSKGHAASETLFALFTCIAPERIQRSLQPPMFRSSYAADEEYAAEYLASLLEQLVAQQRMDGADSSPDEQDVRTRLMLWTNELRGQR